jgi:hypothetical protein
MTEPQSASPPPEQPIPPRADLKVRRDVGVGQTEMTPCPNCKQLMPPGAVICTNCGLDLRTGKCIKPGKGESKQTYLVAIGVGIAVAVGLFFWLQTNQPAQAPTAPAVPAEPAAPEPSEITEEPADELPAELAIADTSSRANTEEAVSAATDIEPLGDTAARAARRAELTAQLDANRPMYAIGDSIQLVMANGFVHRGELIAIREGVVLVREGDQRLQVPMAEMQRRSRIQVDQGERERMIDDRLNQEFGANETAESLTE